MVGKKKPGTQAAPTWTLRGIAPETRNAVGMAARRAGLGVGEWCDRTLRDAATEALKEAPPPAIRTDELLAQLITRLDAMERAQRVPFWRRWFGLSADRAEPR